MRSILFTFAFLTMLLTGASSRADIVYDFHETSATGFLGTLPPSAYSPRLVVTDTAPLTGIDFTRTCAFPPGPISCTTTGSMAGFVSLTDTTPNFGSLSINLTFNPDETLTGSILEKGIMEDLDSSGSHFDWQGTLLSDRYPGCGAASPCTFTGYWLTETAVPEPGTLGLLVSAFAMLLIARRRHRA